MFTLTFWKDTCERVIATAAEAAATLFVGHSLWDIDYRAAAGIIGGMAVASLLKSLASARLGTPGTAAPIRTSGQ